MKKEQFFKPNRLREEVDSWAPFVESLTLEDRQLFKDMVQDASSYLDLIEFCIDGYTTEAFLLGLLISNQKTINSLSNQIATVKKTKEEER